MPSVIIDVACVVKQFINNFIFVLCQITCNPTVAFNGECESQVK